ncbi:signal recognition particle-docking protein FtsY [Salinicola avicenniae]|uniref:signal recognition particle-docking protein FtsY n=1 Tax=Salinicola avicenniae TaxID=2916836 RepID=UPI002072DCB6|nr:MULTISPECIES: signal recognition particle-docking protein FtsY [unclassified Salinicola]
MFGLFKSRKKQQQEQEAARRREAEADENRAASESASSEETLESEPVAANTSESAATASAAQPQHAAEGEPQETVREKAAASEAAEIETAAVAPPPDGEPHAEEETAAESESQRPAAPSSAPEDAADEAGDASPVSVAEPAPEAVVHYDPAAVEEEAAREALSEPLPAEASQSAVEETPAEGTREAELATDVTPAPAPREKPKGGWLARVRAGLSRTRSNLTDGIADLLLGKKQIDDDLIEDLETQLLMADVGIEATSEIIERLTERVSRKELADAEALYRALQEELAALLEPATQPLVLPPKGEGPFVILMVGVNGVGKTTTIGKLTQRFQNEGRSVMLAAGDTFRAAAVEQLKVWGERNHVPVIAQHTGADSASVIYDALAAARARGVDVLIADTAGRLHNKSHLMEELKKVQRVMSKLDAAAPHEVMLVLDAGTGQNALSQASTFNEAIPVTGITLTKLDGTAKGGIIFALAQKMGMPIRFIGVGESLEDLRPFDANTFVKALFDRDGDADS